MFGADDLFDIDAGDPPRLAILFQRQGFDRAALVGEVGAEADGAIAVGRGGDILFVQQRPGFNPAERDAGLCRCGAPCLDGVLGAEGRCRSRPARSTRSSLPETLTFGGLTSAALYRNPAGASRK